ncbi:hypothetical protein JX265_009940 [Neoarthrinium moseri]|uniref:NAD(P)-binding protein n=1 Tax=Neoarthrinium moseri TaxID=1658444 RepID=A0A9P9WF55_9PEZI|nr:uncharacterized protein JN550_008581 [Neoarthrinium moseri]KAI1841493.1 hypothetical protein JX266_012333 [Neoarthrinium moseri]KAI1860541.1 hypothetical protein JX265_009940 [Neoarthrinium moseri]KAI1865035.1 hypothetical protein JN550_008581 [Neoarthrinium moseri]
MAIPASVRLAFTALAVVLPALVISHRLLARNHRPQSIKRTEERVLVLGASSGVGRALARKYADQAARVCIVARREADLAVLAEECGENCIWEAADFSNVDDMVRVRERLLAEWGGLDTLQICAGVSALQPVMALTGVQSAEEDATSDGIRTAVAIGGRAIKGNFDGPFISALTFVSSPTRAERSMTLITTQIPMLTRTSASPSILLLNSLASVVAAPTRALYAASKASSLLLFQALAIEHSKIAFTFMLPSTIEGNFRASAVDGGPVIEKDPNKHGLKIEYVAKKCMDAVDSQITGNIVLPWFPNALGPHVYYLWPSVVEKKARKKYNFE